MTLISPGIEFHSLIPICENEFSCIFSLKDLVKRFFDVEDRVAYWCISLTWVNKLIRFSGAFLLMTSCIRLERD